MVSNASDDLPEPDRPVMTTSASRGIATVTSLRLCSRAPETTIWACRDTRPSVRNARTESSNTCSPPLALCDQLRIGSGFRPFEELVMIRWAPWEAVASRLAAEPLPQGGAGVRTRFAVREYGAAFWIALWTAAVAAELLALRPVVLDRTAAIQGLALVFSLVGFSFAA